jgi:3-oxoacyl-[acyl-carrier protein] reductase
MLDDLKGKRILVTGSSTGIGAAVAIELARLGAAVIVHGNRNASSARDVAEAITKAGGSAFVVMGDVSDSDATGKIVAQSIEALGGLDVLINNAGGIVERVTNAAFRNDLFDKVYELNVKSILNMTRDAYPHLKAAGGGAIINTGSIAGRFGGFAGSTVYASAKAAVHSISRNAAREFASDNIRVNTARLCLDEGLHFVAHQITLSSRPVSTKAAIAWSSSSIVCAAHICVRMRSCPLGTTGKLKGAT